jgi:hypothetical protein
MRDMSADDLEAIAMRLRAFVRADAPNHEDTAHITTAPGGMQQQVSQPAPGPWSEERFMSRYRELLQTLSYAERHASNRVILELIKSG